MVTAKNTRTAFEGESRAGVFLRSDSSFSPDRVCCLHVSPLVKNEGMREKDTERSRVINPRAAFYHNFYHNQKNIYPQEAYCAAGRGGI